MSGALRVWKSPAVPCDPWDNLSHIPKTPFDHLLPKAGEESDTSTPKGNIKELPGLSPLEVGLVEEPSVQIPGEVRTADPVSGFT